MGAERKDALEGMLPRLFGSGLGGGQLMSIKELSNRLKWANVSELFLIQ